MYKTVSNISPYYLLDLSEPKRKGLRSQHNLNISRTFKKSGDLIRLFGWFAGKCLISGPDTLRSYKQENRNGGKFLSVDLCSLRSYS